MARTIKTARQGTVRITDDAMALCNESVRQLSGAQTNSKCLRLLNDDGRICMSFEMPRNNDTIVSHAGQSVLAVPEHVADRLAGRTLDLNDDGAFVIA